MKFLSVFFIACLGAAWAQTAPPAAAPAMPDLPDQAVVAVLDDGVLFTMGDFKKLYAALPPPIQQNALRDRKAFMESWGFMRKLALMAEKEKLDQESPIKETIEYYRWTVLSQAKINAAVNAATVEPAEIIKYYDVNKEKYKQVRVKALYVSFGGTGKNARTEAEAKAKAAKLLAGIRGGADFVKLVKENSDDETSRAKDGDFATLRPSDNIPDAIRAAVFALKQGAVSDPVGQPNGIYLLRAEEVTYRPLSQVRDEIFTDLKQEHFKQWLDQTHDDAKIRFPSPSFAGAAAAPAK